MKYFVFIASVFLGFSILANPVTPPLLEFIHSPGRPSGNGNKYIAKQCLVNSQLARMMTVDLLTGERIKSESPVNLDLQLVLQLINKAAQQSPKLEIGPTDVPSTYYYAWTDENPAHRTILRASGSHSGENSTPEAKRLIFLIEKFCQLN